VDYRSEDGPRPDRSVLRELRRVDPDVYPVWRNYWMDATTGRRLYREDGTPAYAPQWWIMKRCADGVHRLLFRCPHFDNRVWRMIEADAARHRDAQQIEDAIEAAAAQAAAQAERKIDADNCDFHSANRGKLSSILEGDNYKITDDRGMRRDQKISSYGGQKNRTSGRDSVPISDKEAGWEMPWGENA
jgi:hypothetical protein